MALMSPADMAFLLPETREQPMHVGSLQLYRKPDDAGPDFLPDTYRQLISVDPGEIASLFRQRAYRSLGTLGQWAWTEDREIDLEHHIRHSALPRPGRIRELLALTSRLHGTLLDRHRPLWEMHLIEGLEDGRFAVYTKMHHSVMDGVSALRLMGRMLSDDPDDRFVAAPLLQREERRPSESKGLGALPGAALGAMTGALSLAPGLIRVAERAIRDQGATTLPMQAPRTILNGGITGARRFAAQSWPLQRLQAVARAAGMTLNDVVLGMSAGALRTYLDELSALPDAPLTAMVPMSLRTSASDDTAGNAVGAILCSLATDVVDPEKRLTAIHESMCAGKAVLAGMNRVQVTAVSALALAPVALGSTLGAATRLLPPPFNLVISNVPGPRNRLWWNGAELDAVYPLSIPTAGQALNITVTSYADSMEFGLTGCRRSAPHLQRLLGHLDTALTELETVAA